MNNGSSVNKLVLCSFGIAVTFLMTVFIVIPMAGMGYVNFGDAGLMLFATILGPAGSFAVGGIGSALADIYLGYSQYAIFTLVIKGLEAVLVSLMFKRMKGKLKYGSFFLGGLWMIIGYYFTDVIMIGSFVAVLPAVQGNLLQAGVCITLAIIAQTSFSTIASRNKKLVE